MDTQERTFRRGDLVSDANGRRRRVGFVGEPDHDGDYRVGLVIPGVPRLKFVVASSVKLAEESELAPEKAAPAKAEPSPKRAEPKRAVPAAAMPHQVEGVAWLEEHPSAILADQPGLGKTLQTIASMDLPAIVVCPAVMRAEWADEIAKWRPGVSVSVVSGTKAMDEAAYVASDVVVLNYDIVAAHEAAILAAHDKRPYRTLVCDEAHLLKTLEMKKKRGQVVYSGSERAKSVVVISRKVPRRIMLSATPVLNRPIELFPLLHVIDPDEWSDYVAYGKRFCAGFLDEIVAKGGRRVRAWNFTGSSNEEEMSRILASKYMLRRTKDVLSLPEKRRETISVIMSRSVGHEYIEATRDFLSWVAKSGGPTKVAKAKRAEQLAKMTALRGLAAKGKVEFAANWIMRHQDRRVGSLVVMAHHREVIDGLASAIAVARPGLRVGRIVGGQSERSRKDDKEAFQRGDLDVILCSIMAAGVGLTLTKAAETLFVERSWRPMDLVQAEDRIHRIGQTRPVTITYLDARGTIDESLAKMLMRKTATIAGVIEGDAIDEQEAARRVLGELLQHGATQLSLGLTG